MKTSTVISITKLQKVLGQIQVAQLADYSYPDGYAALEMLKSKVTKEIEKVISADDFSTSTRSAIIREANYLLIRFTQILGVINRSLSVRNAFELYIPFLDICRNIVGDDARLLLSSEWQYVPFTYPQSIAELPDFIIIGLPATESDNMLIFPAAGHELGHTIWNKKGLSSLLKSKIRGRIDTEYEQNKDNFYRTFPALKDADLDQDIFVQSIKGASIASTLAQLEETFCDFIGMLLFGESFLFSFEYLISPMLSGIRSFEYPETKNRAVVLHRFSQRLGIEIDHYLTAFSSQEPIGDKGNSFVVNIADVVVVSMLEDVFVEAQTILTQAGVSLPSVDVSSAAEKKFKRGVPYEGEATIGDLVNAAWRVFRSGETKVYDQQGRLAVDYVSDLVMKSIEIYEIRKRVA